MFAKFVALLMYIAIFVANFYAIVSHKVQSAFALMIANLTLFFIIRSVVSLSEDNNSHK